MGFVITIYIASIFVVGSLIFSPKKIVCMYIHVKQFSFFLVRLSTPFANGLDGLVDLRFIILYTYVHTYVYNTFNLYNIDYIHIYHFVPQRQTDGRTDTYVDSWHIYFYDGSYISPSLDA